MLSPINAAPQGRKNVRDVIKSNKQVFKYFNIFNPFPTGRNFFLFFFCLEGLRLVYIHALLQRRICCEFSDDLHYWLWLVVISVTEWPDGMGVASGRCFVLTKHWLKGLLLVSQLWVHQVWMRFNFLLLLRAQLAFVSGHFFCLFVFFNPPRVRCIFNFCSIFIWP